MTDEVLMAHLRLLEALSWRAVRYPDRARARPDWDLACLTCGRWLRLDEDDPCDRCTEVWDDEDRAA